MRQPLRMSSSISSFSSPSFSVLDVFWEFLKFILNSKTDATDAKKQQKLSFFHFKKIFSPFQRFPEILSRSTLLFSVSDSRLAHWIKLGTKAKKSQQWKMICEKSRKSNDEPSSGCKSFPTFLNILIWFFVIFWKY